MRATGCVAALAMVVVGCQSITRGSATADRADVPAYRASVSSSVEASASRSAAKEAERQARLAKEAVHRTCDLLSSSSVDAVAAVNAYVSAYNDNASDLVAKAGPAIVALNGSAAQVEGSLSDLLAPELTAALRAWVDASRALAGAIAADVGMTEFNAAVEGLNTAQQTALDRCDAAY